MSLLREKPGYWSPRVRRAYRTNGVERVQLSEKLALLDRQRTRQVRLTNQDMRLVTLSLEYIRTCSGSSRQVSNDSLQSHGDKPPCFLYGERITTRKKRRKIQSSLTSINAGITSTAIDINFTGSHKTNDKADSAISVTSEVSAEKREIRTKTNDYDGFLNTIGDIKPSPITKQLLKKQLAVKEKRPLYENESDQYAKKQSAIISRVLKTQATLENIGNEDTIRVLRDIGDMTHAVNESRTYVMPLETWKAHVERQNIS